MTLQEAYEMTERTWERLVVGSNWLIVKCCYCVYHNSTHGVNADCNENTCPLWKALGHSCMKEPCYEAWNITRTPEDAAKVLARLQELKPLLLGES